MRAEPMPAWAGGTRRRRLPVRRRFSSGWLVPLTAAVVLGIWAVSGADDLPQSPLSGTARAVDGDTLRLGAERVRLHGLDAPELQQSCRDGADLSWDCGIEARRRLAELLAVGEARCELRDRDRYGRLVATCRVDGRDVAEPLLEEGLAVADGPLGYEGLASRARRAGRGIWAGTFDQPAAWRQANSTEPETSGTPSRIGAFLNWVENVFAR